jgi:tRNA-specific 2-thiouridylase
MSKKILVAISGGVDSSVAALILKQKGFEVIGVFMNFWSENQEDPNKCCSIESVRFARNIAKKLKIKLYSINCRNIFKNRVVKNYIESHEKGITPNPCVVCNREVKFRRLLRIAINLGATKVATGHYAKLIKNEKTFELHRGRDKMKDQSYFLWGLPASSLPLLEFPIGNMNKNEVRKLARKYKLITYNNKDSQGLCFIGESKYQFLSKYAKKLLEPGNVVDISGEVIGQHQGLSFYTIGQRAGFITNKDKWRQNKKDVPPLYVIRLIPEKNILVVGENKDVFQKKLVVRQLNWLDDSFDHFSGERNILAQIRYQHKAKPCTISYINQKNISVVFRKPERAITPGQSCVFYQKDRLLGGGFIMK